MARLIGILVILVGLAACSSGVSNSGAGAAGTDCKGGDLNLICTADITMSSTAINAFASSTAGLTTDSGTLNITITDPLGTFAHIYQGATFNSYDIIYSSGQPRAPKLGTRRVQNTLSIVLNGGTGSGSISLPIVDLTTKKEFSNQDSGGKVFPYLVTVQATGRDFATNTQIVVDARINIEIGEFASTGTTPTSGSTSMIDYKSGLEVASADLNGLKNLHVLWQ